jgi:hypothetical protein
MKFCAASRLAKLARRCEILLGAVDPHYCPIFTAFA